MSEQENMYKETTDERDVQMLCTAIRQFEIDQRYNCELLTNKLLNQYVSKYIQMLETYYARINKIALCEEEYHDKNRKVNKCLSDTLDKCLKIQRNIKKNYGQAMDVVKQNERLISYFLDINGQIHSLERDIECTQFSIIKEQLNSIENRLKRLSGEKSATEKNNKEVENTSRTNVGKGRKFCKKCGAERKPGIRFCVRCGANFSLQDK